MEKKIELIALFPNSTHILQPMDVSVFHPLKNSWKTGVQQYKIDNDGGKIKKENFGPLLKKVIDQAITPSMIKNGFKTCGLFPFDQNGIPYDKFFKNRDRPQSVNEQQKIYQTTKKEVNFFEYKIGPEKITRFEESGDIWEGNVEDTALFNFWRLLSEEVEDHKMATGNNESSRHLEHGQNDASYLEEINNDDTDYRHQFVQLTPPNQPIRQLSVEIEKSEPRPAIDMSNKTNNSIPSTSKDIPSPFKGALFWPKPITKKTVRKIKEKIPSVATSDQWRDYHQRKELEKQRKEQEKEERKRKRELAKIEKENKFKSRKKD